MSDPPGRSDLPGQLAEITEQLEQSNPELYRQLALYLQTLRQVLPRRVKQACFHLATQVHPQRYAELPIDRRQLLHGRMERLVRRCTCLLTVEHLATLAAQIARERRRREHQDHQQILDTLTRGEEDENGLRGGGDPTSEAPLPPGSVRLGFAPPLSGGSFSWGPGATDWDPSGEESPGADDPSLAGPPHGPPAASGESFPSVPTETEEDGDAAAADDEMSSEQSPWQQGPLPSDPVTLLRWLDGMELALARRLRNLSHAINVELLRAGVNRSLLPVSLLDAVLSGQLETMAAPPNLLRLPLPFSSPSGKGQAQTMAVLLRSFELELEEPRLRTCRRRLQQHRQEIRRMALQFRRLQRRLRTHQAEQLWLQDIRATPGEGD